MNALRYLGIYAVLGVILLSGCSSPHGQPQKGAEVLAPNEVLDFKSLYADNCAGCHAKLDPLGFGLENFNAIGKWREQDNKQPIDSSGRNNRQSIS